GEGAVLGAESVRLWGERARFIGRLRCNLQKLELGEARAGRALNRLRNLEMLAGRLTAVEGTVARIARNLVDRCRTLTIEINELEHEISLLVEQLAPSLLAISGCGSLTAAKLLGETAGVERFKSKDA